MVDAHYFYNLILNPVDHDIGKAGENQLASSGYPPLATQMWKLSQIPAAIVEGLGYVRSSFRIVTLNMANDPVEIISGGSGPTDAH